MLAHFARYSAAGISKALRRLGVSRQRGRLQVHSPDAQYRRKFLRLEQVLLAAWAHPEQVCVLFGDEAGCYRQPTLASAYARRGHQPRVDLSHRRNSVYRIAGTLDAVSGRVVWLARETIGVAGLCALLRRVREAYPDRQQRLVLVWDNWPVHAHAQVLALAESLGIELLWLPTYAPWLNPIEKLWRKLRQDVLHHHRLADQWDLLKQRISSFLDRFADGSPDLLRYVGLSLD